MKTRRLDRVVRSDLLLKIMEVNLSTELASKLSRIAAEQGRSMEALVEEAIERFLDYDQWFAGEVEKGLAAAERANLWRTAT